MKEAGQVAAEIPHLRRHAHALTGSWSRGDHYTRRALRAAAADPGGSGSASTARIGLYRTLHRIWARSGEAGASGCRESLLLTRGAQFAPNEVAEILDLPVSAVRSLAHRAAAELADRGARTVLILTDGAPDEDAATLSLPDGYAVLRLGCARSSDAAAALGAAQADLLVADCRRDAAAGAALAAAACARMGELPALFLTAHPAELLACKLPPAAWILPWPCPIEELCLAIDQVLLFHTPAIA